MISERTVSSSCSSYDRTLGTDRLLSSAEFRTLLHQVIQDGLREKVDDIQINGAIQLGNGWMHIHGMCIFLFCLGATDTHFLRRLADDRNVPALGRIGDPDDIIATVLVENGEVRALHITPFCC